ncbi:hypothetical protein [Alishewanella sp. SMS8]|uniref:hypothetical protein n=1 Tax=Alishewanella sp. SMS8 TaxID=2994676 RepID=UPI0027425511|nr:hypothetical protein [Alishewanella sp. SMS8]MDP5458013.1 hypothetical protein [Alishewanella sp. SMS8]
MSLHTLTLKDTHQSRVAIKRILKATTEEAKTQGMFLHTEVFVSDESENAVTVMLYTKERAVSGGYLVNFLADLLRRYGDVKTHKWESLND